MEPFVPEPDGRIGKPAGSTQAKAPKAAKPPQPPRNGGGNKLVTVSLFVICALLGAALFVQWNTLSDLNSRFKKLQTRIESTDESLSQSGTALSMRLQQQAEELEGHEERLDKNFSEIDKLWAARKKINDTLGQLDTKVSDLDKTLGGIDGKIAAATKSTATLENSISALRREILDLKVTVAGVDEQTQKIAVMEKTLQQWQKKLSSYDEAIAAIDSFRKQANNDILELRQRSGGSGPDLSQIRRDIETLKAQHPYLGQ